MFEQMSRLRTLIDEVRRRTLPQDKELFELFDLALASCKEIERLEDDVSNAWADADQMAWRTASTGALQSLVSMTAIAPSNDGAALMLVVKGQEREQEVSKPLLAKLAGDLADELVKIDRAKRKGDSET